MRRHTEVRGLLGDDRLSGVVAEDNRTGERGTLAVGAVFTFIGARPHTEWLRETLELDPGGFVRTGHDLPADPEAYRPLGRPPTLLETSLPSVFAVGDVRSGSVKRVASAVGEGSIVVRLVFGALSEPRFAPPA